MVYNICGGSSTTGIFQRESGRNAIDLVAELVDAGRLLSGTCEDTHLV